MEFIQWIATKHIPTFRIVRILILSYCFLALKMALFAFVKISNAQPVRNLSHHISYSRHYFYLFWNSISKIHMVITTQIMLYPTFHYISLFGIDFSFFLYHFCLYFFNDQVDGFYLFWLQLLCIFFFE